MDYLIFNNYPRLKAMVQGYKKVKIFTDETTPQWAIDKFAENILQLRLVVSKVVLPKSYLSVSAADSIAPTGEDLVVALGCSHTISIAKYYAYCHIRPIIVVPFGEICQHDFSKYALIKDIKLCFYVCESPAAIFIDQDFFTESQTELLYSNLTYQNIVTFEKEFNEHIYNVQSAKTDSLVLAINKADTNLHSLASIYASCGLLCDNNKTSDIVGCNYTLAALACKEGENLSQTLNSAGALVTKFYDCLFRFDIIQNVPNLNLHIKRLKDYFGINCMQTISLMPTLPQPESLVSTKGKLHAYMPYLKAKLSACKSLYKPLAANFSSKLVASLALAASTTTKSSPLTFARDFGYFDPLLKGDL